MVEREERGDGFVVWRHSAVHRNGINSLEPALGLNLKRV